MSGAMLPTKTLAAILPLATLMLAGPLRGSTACGATAASAVEPSRVKPAEAAVAPPPDLRVEWVSSGAPTREGEPVRGKAGEVRRLEYQVRNVGGADAFAIILAAQTALGPFGKPVRIEPGPQPGRLLRRTLELPLAEGMREVCIEAALQTSNADDPHDPNPQDNRLCRRVEIRKEADHGDR
jgi:hypothetical protein